MQWAETSGALEHTILKNVRLSSQRLIFERGRFPGLGHMSISTSFERISDLFHRTSDDTHPINDHQPQITTPL